MLNSEFLLHPALVRESTAAQEVWADIIGKGGGTARRKKEDRNKAKFCYLAWGMSGREI